MSETLDAQVREKLAALPAPTGGVSIEDPGRALAYYRAQVSSRHLDQVGRDLQAIGEGFYTISSAGHEANAAVALALRPDDPALLHYRSGGFYCARAGQVTGHDAERDVLLSLMAGADDPISGGRHKVLGNRDLHVIPQTSTIASHLPRAVGVAFGIERAHQLAITTPWPRDAIAVASLGDASVNHNVAVGALNAAGHAVHQGARVPLLIVVEDNGLGISVRTPAGWLDQALARPGFSRFDADGTDPAQALWVAEEAASQVRRTRQPAILHLRTVRFLGHAGSDAEIAYRSPAEIAADRERDPLVATAAWLVAARVLTAEQALAEYDEARDRARRLADSLLPVRRLATRQEVSAPLTTRRPAAVMALSRSGETAPPPGDLTLAQSLNAALADLLATQPQAIVLGEDVGAKGGVYGVTRGLQKQFGRRRVFDTLLDETTILGTGLGTSLAGLLPIPEIQYLAYLHNAEDQLRGEGASLAFFSNGQYTNPMVVRVPGLAYQKGFGGHFHNDHSLAVLRDIPGLLVACASHPAEAPGLLRTLTAVALAEGRVCVLVEPIALYHERDLLDGDGGWLAAYDVKRGVPRDSIGVHGDGDDVLVVTFGNGVRMARRAVARTGVAATVADLRWLAPLPEAALLDLASEFARVLVVDETRRSGGVGEGVVTALVEGGYRGQISRVSSADSYVPLGPAAAAVLLAEDDVAAALLDDRA